MTKDLKQYFTKKEKLTHSILDKLSDIAFKNNYNK